MLRIHPVSDLHTDIKHNEWDNPPVDADVIVCAGDAMAPATLAIRDVRRRWPHQEIIYVMGNHDFYSDHRHPDTKTTWEWQRANAPKVAAAHDVRLLDQDACVIGGVRFLGCTLWTDFMARPPETMFGDAVRGAMRMNDYRLIKRGRGRSHDLFKPKDSIADHHASRKWLTEQLATPFDGETVVATHHAPSVKSLMTGRPYHDLDWCYASNCEALMHTPGAVDGQHRAPSHVPPVVWIHGHIHSQNDYQIGNTRIIANPRGYPAGHHWHWRPGGPRENPDFNPTMVVEVDREPTPKMGM
jgi:hypothetical protein